MADGADRPDRAPRMSPAGVLSYAEQRALEIGVTIAGGADVVLLDEPTAGMNNSETEQAVALIRKVTEGKTLVMVEHDMGVVFSLADRISVLVYGEIIASDTPERIRENAAVREAYLGQAAVTDGRAAARSRRPRMPITARATSCTASRFMSARARSSACSAATASAARPRSRRSWAMSRRRARSASSGERDRRPEAARDGAARGSATCPKRATSFPALTVRQNLHARREARQDSAAAGRWRTCSACSRSSRSAPTRRAGVLSGGEQQMLTICRTLMGDPDLIMIDEPTEGLSPMMVEHVGAPARGDRRARRRHSAGRAEADDRAQDQRTGST